MDDVRGQMWAHNALTTLQSLNVRVGALQQPVFMPDADEAAKRKIEFAAYELSRSIECLKAHLEKKAA